MADQISGLTGGLGGQGLGTVTGVLQGGVSNLLNAGQSWLDRFIPPDRREEMKNKIAKFATEKPQLAAFLLSQIALSGGPLFLFAVMSLTVFVVALVAGLLVGVLGAVLFTVFCVGVALIVLLPILFFTTAAATFVFLWGLGAYYIVKWFNKKPVPGIHKDAKGGLAGAAGLDNIPALNGDISPHPPTGEKTQQQANGSAAHVEHREPQKLTPKKKDTGKSTGVAGGAVDGVHKKTGAVTNGINERTGGVAKPVTDTTEGVTKGVTDRAKGVTDKTDGITKGVTDRTKGLTGGLGL